MKSKTKGTVCVLQNARISITLQTPMYSLASLWFTNKKGMLIDTGLLVDTNNKGIMEVLKKYPYTFQPLNYQEVLDNIKDYNVHSAQIVTSVIEPIKKTKAELFNLLVVDKSRGNTQMNFKDIYNDRILFFYGVDEAGNYLVGGEYDNP